MVLVASEIVLGLKKEIFTTTTEDGGKKGEKGYVDQFVDRPSRASYARSRRGIRFVK